MISESELKRIKKGAWLHLRPSTASTRNMGKLQRAGYFETDTAYGPVLVEQLEASAGGTQLVFHIAGDHPRLSRVWWL
jgi:hypothetical protein